MAGKSVWDYMKEGVKKVPSELKSMVTPKKAAAEPAPSKKQFTSEEDIERAIKERGKQIKEATPDSYKKGGKVKKGGMAKVHTGEHVLTTRQTKKLESNPKIKKALGVKKS